LKLKQLNGDPNPAIYDNYMKKKELYRESGAEPWFLSPFMQVVAERVSEGVASGEKFDCTKIVQCHKSVIVFGSKRRKTDQSHSRARSNSSAGVRCDCSVRSKRHSQCYSWRSRRHIGWLAKASSIRWFHRL